MQTLDARRLDGARSAIHSIVGGWRSTAVTTPPGTTRTSIGGSSPMRCVGTTARPCRARTDDSAVTVKTSKGRGAPDRSTIREAVEKTSNGPAKSGTSTSSKSRIPTCCVIVRDCTTSGQHHAGRPRRPPGRRSRPSRGRCAGRRHLARERPSESPQRSAASVQKRTDAADPSRPRRAPPETSGTKTAGPSPPTVSVWAFRKRDRPPPWARRTATTFRRPGTTWSIRTSSPRSLGILPAVHGRGQMTSTPRLTARGSSGAGGRGRGRTDTPLARHRLLRPARLPFRHSPMVLRL